MDHTTTYASVKKPTPATKQTLMWNHLRREVRRVQRADEKWGRTRRGRCRSRRGRPYAAHPGRHSWSGRLPCRWLSCWGRVFRRSPFGRLYVGGSRCEPWLQRREKTENHRLKYDGRGWSVHEDTDERASGTQRWLPRSIAPITRLDHQRAIFSCSPMPSQAIPTHHSPILDYRRLGAEARAAIGQRRVVESHILARTFEVDGPDPVPTLLPSVLCARYFFFPSGKKSSEITARAYVRPSSGIQYRYESLPLQEPRAIVATSRTPMPSPPRSQTKSCARLWRVHHRNRDARYPRPKVRWTRRDTRSMGPLFILVTGVGQLGPQGSSTDSWRVTACVGERWTACLDSHTMLDTVRALVCT